MKRKLLTFKTISPEQRDTSRWTKVDTTGMSEEDLQRMERLMPAIVQYLKSGKLKLAAKGAGISASALLKQVNRCLTPLADGGVLGWAGLVRDLRVNPYCRTSELPEGERASQEGAAGAFQRFLADHLDIKDKLDDAIRKGIGKGRARAAQHSVKAIWLLFRRMVEQRITDPDLYPRNQKECARRSVERYVKFMIANDARARRNYVGEAARAAGQIGTGTWSFDICDAEMDLIAIDAHHMDCIGTIEIVGPAGSQWVPLERIWIYAAICTNTRVAHGYSVSIRTEPVAEQIELALDMATKPWKPREICMPGVTYKEGAGFPMGCVEGFNVFAPAALRMDSAMQSFSNRVVHRVRRRFGCALSWSAVGAWYQNDMVERLFGTLERRGIHRLPTSVGSGPSDPMKTDGAAEAVRLKVTWEELLDLIDIAIANYNATVQPGLGYQSPLQVLRNRFDDRQRYVPRALMPPTVFTPELGVAIESAFIRGSLTPSRLRRPYVQIDGETYTNDALAKAYDLLNQPVIVHVHEEDMRKVEAYLENGTYLGWLEVMAKGWRRTKHSRDVRKTIKRLRSTREMDDGSDDYVADYLDYLARKAVADARERPTNVSETATALADAARTTGMAVPKVGVRTPAAGARPSTKPVPLLLNLPTPDWV